MNDFFTNQHDDKTAENWEPFSSFSDHVCTVSSGHPASDPLVFATEILAVTFKFGVPCFQTKLSPFFSQSFEYLYMVESSIYVGDLWPHPPCLNKPESIH